MISYYKFFRKLWGIGGLPLFFLGAFCASTYGYSIFIPLCIYLMLAAGMWSVDDAIASWDQSHDSKNHHAYSPLQRSTENRLDELERLKRRDMVTPGEYATKRQEILKDL